MTDSDSRGKGESDRITEFPVGVQERVENDCKTFDLTDQKGGIVT